MPSEEAFELVDEIRFMLGEYEFNYTTKQAAELIDKAIAEAVNEATINLVRVLADIRTKTGVGQEPTRSELADAIVAKRDEAVKEAVESVLATVLDFVNVESIESKRYNTSGIRACERVAKFIDYLKRKPLNKRAQKEGV